MIFLVIKQMKNPDLVGRGFLLLMPYIREDI